MPDYIVQTSVHSEDEFIIKRKMEKCNRRSEVSNLDHKPTSPI